MIIAHPSPRIGHGFIPRAPAPDPAPSVHPALLGLATAAIVGVAVSYGFRGAVSWSVVLGGMAAFIAGAALRARLRTLGDRPRSLFVLGVVVGLASFVLRSVPWAVGSANAVVLGSTSFVVGEIAAVLAIIATGMMMTVVGGDDLRNVVLPPARRVAVRTVAVLVAVAPLLPFALASGRDLGPLVVLLIAVVVMAARALHSRYLLLVCTVGGLWLLVSALAAIPLARDRLIDTLEGGYQLDLARIAIAHGGLLWGGGLGDNAFAAAIPVAESDHLMAFLAGTLGVGPALGLVAVLMLAARRLVRRLVGADDPGAIAALGLLVAFVVQAFWATAGSFGLVPLTGLAVPVLAVAGSSWIAWGFALGFVVLTGGRRQRRTTAPDRVARALVGVISAVTAVTLVAGVATGATLLFGRESRGTATGYATLAERGELISRDGVVLANTANGGERRWPLGADAVEVVGALVPGLNHYGMEQIASRELVCGDASWLVMLRGLVGPRCHSADVLTTVDSRVQAAIVSATADYPGASAVVVNGRTLDLLGAAGVSNDRFDPNGLTTGALDPETYAPSVTDSPLRPAVLADAHAPGSLFKVLVLAAAAETGVVSAPSDVDTTFAGVSNAWSGACPESTAVAAIAFSCNTVTAAIAAQVGTPELANALQASFGIDDIRTVDGHDLSGGSSGLTESISAEQLARTAIGLEGVRMTLPALAESFAHALGLDTNAVPGRILGRCQPDGAVIPSVRDSDPVGAPLSPTTVELVRAGMRDAVTSGSAQALRSIDGISNHDVLAKTGTPDRFVGDERVFDSLAAVVIDDIVIVVRVPGQPGIPAPSALGPAGVIAEAAATTMQTELIGCAGGANRE